VNERAVAAREGRQDGIKECGVEVAARRVVRRSVVDDTVDLGHALA